MKGNLAPGCIWKIRQEHDFLIFQRVFPPRLFAILGFTQNFKPALFLFDSSDRQTLNFKYKDQTLFWKSMIKNCYLPDLPKYISFSLVCHIRVAQNSSLLYFCSIHLMIKLWNLNLEKKYMNNPKNKNEGISSSLLRHTRVYTKLKTCIFLYNSSNRQTSNFEFRTKNFLIF